MRLGGKVGIAACLVLLAVSGPVERDHECARKVGVEWTREDGVTERLDSWVVCMGMAERTVMP